MSTDDTRDRGRASGEDVSRNRVREHYARMAGEYDRRANRICKATWREVVLRCMGGARRVAEIGAGPSPLVADLDAPYRVAADFSVPMLTAGTARASLHRVAADAVAMPFADGAFDAVFCVNLLEHTSDPVHVASEAARLLCARGRFLAITPNGDLAWLLHLLERLRLKLPEGPHRFLRGEELRGIGRDLFKLIEYRRFALFPVGLWGIGRTIDKLGQSAGGRGLFHYVMFEKTV